MWIVNRQAILVKVKQPFVDWLSKTSMEHDPPEHKKIFKLSDMADYSNVYLIENVEDVDLIGEYIDNLKPSLFEAELSGWYNERAMHFWPKDRSKKVFDEWFEIELSSMVYDIEGTKLKKERY